MTLIVAFPAIDGLVFGSDRQITAGRFRHTGDKIFRLNDHVLWGASGEVAVIQLVRERLDTLNDRDQPLDKMRDAIAGFVRESVTALLQADFRTQFFQQNPDRLLELHPADMLVVEYRERPRVLHILGSGISEWIEHRFAATGNGALFAHALLQKYGAHDLSCASAKLLVYKVIEEAIDVGAYGLGGPVDIYQINANGATRTDGPELPALKDSAKLLRAREIELLDCDSRVAGSDASARDKTELEHSVIDPDRRPSGA